MCPGRKLMKQRKVDLFLLMLIIILANYANPLIGVGIRFFAGAHQLFNPLMLQIISNKEYSLVLYYTLPKKISANYALGAHD